jgi:hypothetical protein
MCIFAVEPICTGDPSRVSTGAVREATSEPKLRSRQNRQKLYPHKINESYVFPASRYSS